MTRSDWLRNPRRDFGGCDRGELTLVVLPTVVAECVFVLGSFYMHPRAACHAHAGGVPFGPASGSAWAWNDCEI